MIINLNNIKKSDKNNNDIMLHGRRPPAPPALASQRITSPSSHTGSRPSVSRPTTDHVPLESHRITSLRVTAHNGSRPSVSQLITTLLVTAHTRPRPSAYRPAGAAGRAAVRPHRGRVLPGGRRGGRGGACSWRRSRPGSSSTTPAGSAGWG